MTCYKNKYDLDFHYSKKSIQEDKNSRITQDHYITKRQSIKYAGRCCYLQINQDNYLGTWGRFVELNLDEADFLPFNKITFSLLRENKLLCRLEKVGLKISNQCKMLFNNFVHQYMDWQPKETTFNVCLSILKQSFINYIIHIFGHG